MCVICVSLSKFARILNNLLPNNCAFTLLRCESLSDYRLTAYLLDWDAKTCDSNIYGQKCAQFCRVMPTERYRIIEHENCL